MRRISRLLPLLVAVLVCGCASASAASAASLPYQNPMKDGLTGKPLSCPDPSVANVHRGDWNYFLVCTSDNARNAFPIWMSEDLEHWYPDGYVFPYRHQPWWAASSDGRTRNGIFWAPSIYRINGHWQVYFAAAYDNASHALGKVTLPARTMVLGVATADALAGPWHTRLLHYAGEFNAANPVAQQELSGGDIDPGVVRDPGTGQLYIFWAEQQQQIWEGALSADGLSIDPHIQLAFSVTEKWECDPLDSLCTIEGPEPFYHDGRIYVMYSAASTWDPTYAVGVASAPEPLNPAEPFVKYPSPILATANGFLGPGRTSHPVVGPHGQSLILYHALVRKVPAHHYSGARTLMLGSFNWVNGWPLINDGSAR